MKHSLEYLWERPWAITEPALQSISKIAHREAQDADKIAHAFHGYLQNPEGSIKAVAVKSGRFLEGTGNRVEMRGHTAILDITGPLFRYANIFTALSGATSVELLGRDFGTALSDPAVESILLNVNSPGGEADGIGELAGIIYKARTVKLVWSYVGGWAASGGYWLASAADRLIFHRTAFGGSIGVIATLTDDRKRRERDGYTKHEIVSSQSPLKRVDPETDEGQELLKGMVDSMAAHFIDEVAKFRDVTAEDVQEHFGKGFVIDAPRALSVGMADEMGTYEDTVAELNGGPRQAYVHGVAAATVPVAQVKEERKEQPMAEETQPAVALDESAIRASERDRCRNIVQCEEAQGRRQFAEHLAFENTVSVEQARKFLAQTPQAAVAAEAKPADQFAAHMEQLGNPTVGVSSEPVDDTAQEITSISQYLPGNQKRRAG